MNAQLFLSIAIGFIVFVSVNTLCGIYSRDSWGARNFKSSSSFRKPARYIFIHHTAGKTCRNFRTCASRVRGIQKYHMNNRGWSDIGYNFLVGQDGRIYEGRGWDRVGAHTRGYNRLGYAISFIGNFNKRTPNYTSLIAVWRLIWCGRIRGYISRTYTLQGHRDVGRTSCPGKRLYKIIKRWRHYSPA